MMRKAFALLLTSLIVLLTISLMFTSVVPQSSPPCGLFGGAVCGDIYQEGKTMECYQYRIREETSDHSDRHFYTIWKIWEEQECTLNCTSCLIISTGQGYTWECYWAMKSCSGEWYQYKAKGKSYCYVGYANCDGDWSNGCEVDLKTNSKNCGFCGNDCDVKDGWYCNGNVCEYRDYYCSGGNCLYVVTESYGCDNFDGWYCNGNVREYRNYYCSGGNCIYVVSQSEACLPDYWDCYDSDTRGLYHCSCVNGNFYWGTTTTEDCPKGEECVDGACQEVPEFPAGVTAVFGTSMLMFFMMRRKYVRK